MSFPYEVRRLNIASVLELYRRRYNAALSYTPIDEQNDAPVFSPHTGMVYQNPVERSAFKHFALMIIEVLFELSKSSTKEIQDAFAEVMVFCRFRENTISPYSAIQSILVPGLFYIELGVFLKIDLHIDGDKCQSNALNHLDALKLSGFVPLLQTDLKNAEQIRFCPGGYLTGQRAQSEYCHKLNPHKPSLLTQNVLIKLLALLIQKESQYFLNCSVAHCTGIKNTKIDYITRRTNIFKCKLKALIEEMTPLFATERNDVVQSAPVQLHPALTGFNRADAVLGSSDSDDDFHSQPVPRYNFFSSVYPCVFECTKERSLDEMGPYEKLKRGID